MFKKNKKNKYNSGVTLIELITVITIFLILTAVIIADNSKLKTSATLQNLADDIALSVRKVQSLAVGVRGLNSGGGNVFDSGYGVHFSLDSNTAYTHLGSPKDFILFMDTTNNNIYDENPNNSDCGNPETGENECIEVLSIKSSDKISAVNLMINGKLESKTSGTLDIVFKRPKLEPSFCYMDSSSSYDLSVGISYIEIVIQNDKTLSTKIITVYSTGQIAIS